MSNGLRWTPEEVLAYRARRGELAELSKAEPADPGPESDLQRKIEDWCDSRAFVFFHDRSRGCNRPGFLDLVIALPGGKTLWCELKGSAGRLTEEQKSEVLKLQALGHRIAIVRGFGQFLHVIGQVLS